MFPGNFRLILLCLLFQCRLLMKIYAFVRSNVPRVLRSTATATTVTTGNSTFSSSKKSRKSSSESVDETESNSPSTTTTYSPENSIWKEKEGKLCNLGDDDAAGGVSQVSSSSAENNGGNQEETLDKTKNLEGGGGRGGSDGGDNDVGDDATIAGTWTPKARTTAAEDFPTSGTQSKLRRRINGINGKSKSFGEGGNEEREKFKVDDNVDELSNTSTKLMSLGGSCDLSSENNNNWSGSSSAATTICPSYSKYLYFYVAPTLIYKDNYPRYVYIK